MAEEVKHRLCSLLQEGSPQVIAVAGKVRSVSDKPEIHICVLYKTDQVNENINSV